MREIYRRNPRAAGQITQLAPHYEPRDRPFCPQDDSNLQDPLLPVCINLRLSSKNNCTTQAIALLKRKQ